MNDQKHELMEQIKKRIQSVDLEEIRSAKRNPYDLISDRGRTHTIRRIFNDIEENSD